jgi:hypothetical protein
MNPTLVGQDAPYVGFTVTAAQEELLKTRGLTLDATTGRSLASADEQAAALRYLRMGLDEFHTSFPNVFAFRTFAATWVSGDHSVDLPANAGQPLAVRYNGVDLRPLSRDDLERMRRPTDQGGGILGEESGKPLHYIVTGFSNAGTSPADWRLVVRLFPTPQGAFAAQDLEVDYVALGGALTVVADPLPIWPALQTWVVRRAQEMWCGSCGDTASMSVAQTERAKSESLVNDWVTGSREQPRRVRWRQPNPSSRRTTRYGK